MGTSEANGEKNESLLYSMDDIRIACCQAAAAMHPLLQTITSR